MKSERETYGAVVTAEGHALLVRLHVLEVLNRVGELTPGDGRGGLARVLEVHAEVGALADANRLAVLDQVRRRVLSLSMP